MELKIKETVREKLLTTSMPDSEVARKLDCSVQWVRMFKEDKIKGPSVNRIEQLYFILTGKSLI